MKKHVSIYQMDEEQEIAFSRENKKPVKYVHPTQASQIRLTRFIQKYNLSIYIHLAPWISLWFEYPEK